MRLPAGESVTRLRAPLVADRFSSAATVRDWAAAVSSVIGGCGFNPGGSSEPSQDGRSVVITRPEVYAPAGTDVLASDRLVVRGVTYEVAGNPSDWRSPFTGWSAGVVIVLKSVEG